MSVAEAALCTPERACILLLPGTVLCSVWCVWLVDVLVLLFASLLSSASCKRLVLSLQLLLLNSWLLPSITLGFAPRTWGSFVVHMELEECLTHPVCSLHSYWLKGLLDGTAVSWPYSLTEGFVELTSSTVQLVSSWKYLCVCVN